MDITPLEARRSFNCYSGCVTALLERKGLIYSEPVALGLSGGLNLEFTREGPVHYRGIRELHCITEFLEQRGLRVRREVEADSNAFEELVVRNLAADLPVMVEYDGYYFPFTHIYLRIHERRIGLIVGADDKAYRITDRVYGVEQVEIPRELLFEARSPSLGAAVEPAWYDVSMPKSDRSVGPEVLNAVLSTSEHMLGVSHDGGLQGICGVEQFASQTKQRFQDWHDPVQLAELAEELKQGAILFDHYGEFLQRAPSWTSMCSARACSEAGAEALRIASRLRLISALSLKCAISDVNRCSDRMVVALVEIAERASVMFGLLKREVSASISEVV